jgi:hypothetical protein
MMQVFLAVCHGIGEVEIKLFSQDQWEDIHRASANNRGSTPFNDAVLGATEHLYFFTSLEPLLQLSRAEDIEIVEEWNGCIY